MWAFSLSAAVQAVIAIAQVLHGDAIGLGWLGELKWNPQRLFGSGESTFRGYGLAAHPNILAGYLLVALFATGSLLFQRSLFSPSWFVTAGLFGITFVGLLVTLSRAALLAALVAVTIIVVLKRNQFAPILAPRVILLLTLMLIASIPVIVLFDNAFVERNEGLKDFDGVIDRLTLGYTDTLKVFKAHPFLGAGEGNLMVQVGRNNMSSPKLELLLPAHNAFWVVLAELGIPGLFLFLMACGSVLVHLFAQSKRPGFAWTVAFLAWVIIMIFDYYPWLDHRTRLITFLIIGIWWGYSLRAADELAPAELHLPDTEAIG
jgi:O-antigen ligase